MCKSVTQGGRREGEDTWNGNRDGDKLGRGVGGVGYRNRNSMRIFRPMFVNSNQLLSICWKQHGTPRKARRQKVYAEYCNPWTLTHTFQYPVIQWAGDVRRHRTL